MQTGEWLKPGTLNSIQYAFKMKDGTTRTGFLRFSKHQQEKFEAFHKMPDGDKSHAVLCEIALNPEPDKIDFSREEIDAIFDVDQMVILSKVWMERKVSNPRLSKELDPKFMA
ncbi:hypothetical protein MASR1M12_41850 [Erysipelotrichia bacterium]